MRIFHIVDRETWTAAERAGEYRPTSLETEGFVHFSFAEQVLATWQSFYSHLPDLIVVEVEPALLGSEVRVENGFPHVYGAIPAGAAVQTYELDEFSATGPADSDR